VVAATSRRARAAATLQWVFQLPGERQPMSRAMSMWVQLVMSERGIRAPQGFAYKGHSLRSGGSSAAEAIGVSRFRGNWMGGWSQQGRTRELHYLDPSVGPSRGAWALLGWLADGVYSAGQVETERRRGARDTDEPGEQVGARDA